MEVIEGGKGKKRVRRIEPMDLGAFTEGESDDFIIGMAVGVLRLKILAAISMGDFNLKNTDCGFTIHAPLIAEAKLQKLCDWMNVTLSAYGNYFQGDPENVGKCLYVITPKASPLALV